MKLSEQLYLSDCYQVLYTYWYIYSEDFKLEKGPTDKAKEPDPGGSDQQNLGFKKLKNRKTDRTFALF